MILVKLKLFRQFMSTKDVYVVFKLDECGNDVVFVGVYTSAAAANHAAAACNREIQEDRYVVEKVAIDPPSASS